MRRYVRIATIILLLFGAPAFVSAESEIGSTTDSCIIQLTFPLDYQTFQRNKDNTASVPVRGHCSCNENAVEASWNGGPFILIDSFVTDNYFEGTLLSCPAGQGSLIVRCAASPDCLTQAKFVGVGDVFVIAGQSNASGRASRLNRYSHQTLHATVYSGTENWRVANDPIHTQDKKTKGSVWPLLASRIMEDQDVPVAFIATAMGGTGLVANGHWNPTDGSRFSNMVELVEQSGVNAVGAVLFFQGERDVSHHIPEEKYFRVLTHFARKTADTLPGFPVVIIGQTGQYAPKGGIPAAIDAIRHAQRRTWDSLDIVFPGPITCDLAPLSDGIHFTDDSHIRILADRWWASVRSAIYGYGHSRGPMMAEAYQMPDRKTLSVVFRHNAAYLESKDPARGFDVYDGDRKIPVIAAEIRNPDTVLLYLETALGSDDVQVNYGSGNRAGGLYSPGDIPLPAEPFTGMSALPMLFTPLTTIDTGTVLPKGKGKRAVRRARREGRDRKRVPLEHPIEQPTE